MKAYQITADYSIQSLALVDTDYRTLLPNEVLINIRSASLNYRDLLVIGGFDKWKPPVGRVPASDAVGIVVAAGSEVSDLKINDRVAGLFLPNWQDGSLSAKKLENSLGGRVKDGVLQEYVIFDQHAVIKVPGYLSDAEAATLPCAGLTAWNGMMEKGAVTADSTVLIQGTGGISLFSLQFALMQGAKVILLSGSDDKLEMAKQLGAHHLINYNHTPNWENKVAELTNGKGADHIVEVVGGSNVNKSIRAAAFEGTISLIGLIGGLSGEINTNELMGNQIKLQGIEVGSKEMFTHMNNAITQNKIHPVIDKEYAFTEAKEALSYLKEGKNFGKIVVNV